MATGSSTAYFRGEDESQWKILRANFGDTSMLLDGEVFADGKYLFRVVASTRCQTPPEPPARRN